jgi:hypothetical protein
VTDTDVDTLVTCQSDGCGKALVTRADGVRARGLCWAHYKRWYRSVRDPEDSSERRCIKCGAPMEGKRVDALYCTGSCRALDTKRRRRQREGKFVQGTKRDCAECGTTFKASLPKNIYCSKECWRVAYQRSKRSERVVQCSICGDDFSPGSSMSRYCSKPCRRTGYKRRIMANRYGLSPEKFAEILRGQHGGCAVCGTHDPRVWVVDHDHSCCPGESSCGRCVRGVLCSPCNRGLGVFKDSPQLLQQAARYLMRSNAPEQPGSRYGGLEWRVEET